MVEKTTNGEKMNKKIEKKKEETFEILWDNYWWKLRNFSYRCSHSEVDEREILSTAFEDIIKKKSQEGK